MKNKPMDFSILLTIAVFSLVGTSHAVNSKARLIIKRTNIRLRFDITSQIISKIPIGIILDSEGKGREWYRVNLPPDESEISVSEYIHESIVETVKEVSEVAHQPIPEQEIKEERLIKAEPQYIPKRTPKRNLAFSFYPSYCIVSMSDLNRHIDALNPGFSNIGYKEMKNFKEGLDLLFFEGRFFLFSKLALGLQIGRISREGNTGYLEQKLKVSGLSLTLNGYYYFLPTNKFSPYIGAGAGLIPSKGTFSAYSGDIKANYTGSGLEFDFVGGTEYFLFSSLSIGGEIGYRIAKIKTIKVGESDFYGEEKGEIIIWAPSDPEDHWRAVSEEDLEYYKNQYGYEKLTADFSGLNIKFKLSYYF